MQTTESIVSFLEQTAVNRFHICPFIFLARFPPLAASVWYDLLFAHPFSLEA
jgi:hypothetical protein